MKILTNIPRFPWLYHSIFYDLVRATVGIILLIEGIRFAGNSAMLFGIVEKSRIGGLAFILEHHVVFTLIVGGIFITIGLLTRLSVVFVILVFAGVLINQHAEFGLYSLYGNFAFSLIITLVLVLLFVAGSGKFSVDHYLKSKKQ